MTLHIGAVYSCDGPDCVAGNPTTVVDITPRDINATVTVIDALKVMALRVPANGWATDPDTGRLHCPWCNPRRAS